MTRPIRHKRPSKEPEGVLASGAGVAIRALLVLAMVGLAALTPLPVREALQSATTNATAPLVSAAGFEVATAPPHDLKLTHHTFRIDFECTAFRIILLFVMAVAVTPVSRKRRLQGLLAGVPLIVAANLIRIVGLAGVSELSPHHFDLLHAYTFQAFMIVFAGGAWAYWLHLSRNDWLPAWS